MRIKFLSWQCHIHLSKNHLDAFRDSSCYLYIKHLHQFFVLFLSSEKAWHCISWLSKPPTEVRLWDWALLCYRNLSVFQKKGKKMLVLSCTNVELFNIIKHAISNYDDSAWSCTEQSLSPLISDSVSLASHLLLIFVPSYSRLFHSHCYVILLIHFLGQIIKFLHCFRL